MKDVAIVVAVAAVDAEVLYRLRTTERERERERESTVNNAQLVAGGGGSIQIGPMQETRL